MSNSLTADFSAFVNNRLDCIQWKLKENTDFNRQTDNIDKLTQDLLAAIPTALACTLGDIDDSYTEIITLHEQFSYRQGFKDALRLFSEF